MSALRMSNSTIAEDITWAQHEIDAMWHSINKSPSDPLYHWISYATFIFATLGVLSNLMSVIVLRKLSAHLATFIYLTGLSLSDMITCLMIMIVQLLELLLSTRRSTKVATVLRRTEIICGALAAGGRVLSFWISTAVTMDRWLLICHPIYGKSFCTLHRARVVSRVLFTVALLYSVPLFYEYEVVEVPNVYPLLHFGNDSLPIVDDKFTKSSLHVTKGYSDVARRRLYRWAYMFFNAIFVYTLPTLTIVFFNLQLIRALHRLKSRSKRLRQQSFTKYTDSNNNSRHSRRHFHRSKYSVTIMVIAMVLTLLLCRSPTVVLWVLWSFELTIKTFFDSSSSSGVRRFHNIANLIAIVNAATNFIPFCVFGRLFRAECLTIYCCRKPTSEQLARQAKRRYEQKYQHLRRNSRSKLVQHEPPTTTNSGKDYLRTIPSLNSDSTSGRTPSSNDQAFTNVLRLSDPPADGNGTMHQMRLSLNNTPLMSETMGL